MPNTSAIDQALSAAAAAIHSAEAILIGAGAGMGVDSGLPDFRGNEGFWKAYPPLKKLGLSFVKLANPYWFRHDPQQAWGFYGHRRNLYRATQPHAGFAILQRWCQRAAAGYFVFTSNVDGHFQKAGFDDDRIVECHGSLEHLQCMRLCSRPLLPEGAMANARARAHGSDVEVEDGNDRSGPARQAGPTIWPASPEQIDIDEATFRARGELPSCPHCGGLARPNVLMFGDSEWLEHRTEEQHRRYTAWRKAIRGRRLVVVEIGAGAAVPTVRIECETGGGTLIRINPREAETPPGGISLSTEALEALQAIDAAIEN
jgi:NAD-dependent SIR2 family protein deacetylase